MRNSFYTYVQIKGWITFYDGTSLLLGLYVYNPKGIYTSFLWMLKDFVQKEEGYRTNIYIMYYMNLSKEETRTSRWWLLRNVRKDTNKNAQERVKHLFIPILRTWTKSISIILVFLWKTQLLIKENEVLFDTKY